VPKLKGMKLKAAKTKLGRAHCKLGKVTRKRAKPARHGRVLSSTPGAGKKTSGGVALVIGK
jgi:beta-lactam-binding protein with PASTA domain